MKSLKLFLTNLFKKGPCTCHGCQPIVQHKSRNPNVTYGMHMWVRAGKIHWRQKSRIDLDY